MLEKNKKDENIYKLHYVLLYDYVKDELDFYNTYADKDESFFVDKKQRFPDYNFKPAPPGEHIMFSVTESDVSDSVPSDSDTYYKIFMYSLKLIQFCMFNSVK